MPEGVAGVQGAEGIHRAARGGRRRQSGPVRGSALLHRQGVTGEALRLLVIPGKALFGVPWRNSPIPHVCVTDKCST